MVAEVRAEAKRHQAEVARRDTLLQAAKADLVKVSLIASPDLGVATLL